MTRPTLAYYMFDTTGPKGQGGGTDIFCYSLLNFFKSQQDKIALSVIPLLPSQFARQYRWQRGVCYFAKLIKDYSVWLNNKSSLQVIVYPKLPITAFTNKPALLNTTRILWSIWSQRTKRDGRHIIVIVEDLPTEQGFSKEVPLTALELTPATRLEHTVFQSADVLVVPSYRFADYICNKHAVSTAKIKIFKRNIYMPLEDRINLTPFTITSKGTNVLYSGGLDPRLESQLRQVIKVFKRYPNSNLWVCGHGREYAEMWIRMEGVENVRHVGTLNHNDHDTLAKQCDFGLLIYPRSFYNDMTPTMKYTGYAANGLAILSTELATVVENIQEDGLGKALPFCELVDELELWLSDPSVFTPFKHRANNLMSVFRRGQYMQEWFDQVINEIGS